MFDKADTEELIRLNGATLGSLQFTALTKLPLVAHKDCNKNKRILSAPLLPTHKMTERTKASLLPRQCYSRIMQKQDHLKPAS